MNNKNPLVSVLICSYNAEKFIMSTVKSILSQTYKDIEILILDNCSTDKTLKFLEELQTRDNRIQIFDGEKNIGPYFGLNFLLGKAKGEYIAIDDHDDIWHNEKLEKQIQFLETHKEYSGCGSAIINWYEKYDKFLYRTQPEVSDIAWHTSLVFRNNGYRYDTSVKVGTDFYFMKNILSQSKHLIYNFPEPFVLRRIFKGKQNLSGKWMKNGTILDLINLNIGWFDKLALLNRYIFPQAWVEWMVVKSFKGTIPIEYVNYFPKVG